MTVTVYYQSVPPGMVALDSFPGSDDDTKLGNAMSHARQQPHPPAIQLTNRTHAFSTARTLYTGFRFAGPLGMISNSELADPSSVCRVNVSTPGTWLNLVGGDVYDGFLGNGISFIGTSGTTFMGSTDGSVWHCGHHRDVSFHGFKTVFGTQGTKLLMVASIIDGWFQIAGTYNGGMHIGGSDNRLFTNGALIDSSTAYLNAGGAAGQYHLWCDGLDNTAIGPMYITAEGGWGGIKVSGPAYNADTPSNLGMVEFFGVTNEGRNASAPCYGALWRIEGGIVKIHGGYTARAMSSSSKMGHTPADAGAIHQIDGQLTVHDVTYDRYTGQAETVPFVFQQGGKAIIRDTLAATKGGSWAGLPRVQSTSGTLITDETVTRL